MDLIHHLSGEIIPAFSGTGQELDISKASQPKQSLLFAVFTTKVPANSESTSCLVSSPQNLHISHKQIIRFDLKISNSKYNYSSPFMKVLPKPIWAL